MAIMTPPDDGADARTLRRRLRRAERRRRIEAVCLVVPLLAFLAVTFFVPIGGMLWRSVEDREVARALPRTLDALSGWDGSGLPDEAAFRALAAELPAAAHAGTLAAAARRLNYARSGTRSLVMRTARRLERRVDPADVAATPQRVLTTLSRRWGETETWAAIRQAAGPVTDFYLLAALDFERTATGELARVPGYEAIYVDILIRTFAIAGAVTGLCLLLGFPVAYLLATQPPRRSNLLLILVLLPFWTSLLVRTAAWVVLLQNNGLVNGALGWLGLIEAPLTLIYNRTGVLIAMTHVLLPFMILPLYSVMKGIPPSLVRAARSLGASPLTAFRRVYLPQAMPGVAAGVLLVFILALGYYITPALVGGAADQMIAYFVAFYTTDTINWGMGAALGTVLLATTMVLFFAFGRLIRADRLGLG